MEKICEYTLQNNFHNALSDDQEKISVDLLFDSFQNLILDCKSVQNIPTNKYFINFYQQNKKLYEKLIDLRMKYSDFNVLKIIGQGAFGQVQLVRQKETGDLYALKILNKSQVLTCEGTIFWQEERDIMMKIDSRWIVKLYYAFQDPKRLYMVMDYLPGGNLVNWMSKVDILLEKDVCFYASEIVLGINSLHNFGFVHRDIKPDNLLIDIKGHIKLADFGSCVKMDPITKFVNCNRAIGTPDYISPEVLLSQSDNTKYGKEVDWWALGVMLYEIFYGEPPFYSDNLINTYGKIMTHEQSLSFPLDDEVSEMALDFMKKLICDRSVRLGQMKDASDIKSHKFFNNSFRQWDWDTIQDHTPPFVPILENDLDTSYFDFGEDDVDRNFMNQSSHELKSTTFVGENIQFSGFSYTRCQNANKENIKSDFFLNSNILNEDKLQSSNKENEMNKDTMDKLTIEKKDLETQLHVLSSNFRKEELIFKNLQIDYSDLLTKHSFCQKKIEDLEEACEKLCSDMLKQKVLSEQEIAGLSAQLEKVEVQFKNTNIKLMEIQAEFHHSKLRCVKLENDFNNLKETGNLLENDLIRLRNSSSEKKDEQPTMNDNDFIQLKSDYESKVYDLQKSFLENKCIKNSLETLQIEKDRLSYSLIELEAKFTEQLHDNRKQEEKLKEKDELIEKMKEEMSHFKISVDESMKKEQNTHLKFTNLMKMRTQEKNKYEQEMEEQRNKLSKIITSKTFEIQQMKNSIETFKETNTKLTSQIEMDKIQQNVLIAKINEIIHGKCTTAKEMMITEDLKSGFLGKRSGRLYHQLAKENKRLESMFEEFKRHSQIKEKELSKQIDCLMKDKEQLELDLGSIQEGYYENLTIHEPGNNRASISTLASSQSSFDGGNSLDSSQLTSTFRHSVKLPFGKPPLLSHKANHLKQDLTNDVFPDNGDEKSEIKLRQKRSEMLQNRQSKSESISLNISHNDQLLEVNVKNKGKKMSWEKRFVKQDEQFLYFYGEDFLHCHFKLLFTSLIFVRPASNADVIHAKPSEIPRIFQICYDKNENIYFENQTKKLFNKSSTSINSVDSSKSSKTNSSNDNEVVTLSVDLNDKKDFRKNSLTRFLPLKSLKNYKSKENVEISSNISNHFPVVLKGHFFITINSEVKSICKICKKSLISGISSMTNDHKDITQTQPKITTDLQNHKTRVPTYPDKIYQCRHCLLRIHGYDLDSKMFNCTQSVVIQLFRASSETAQSNWVKYLSQFIKIHTKSVCNSGLSTPNFKPRTSNK